MSQVLYLCILCRFSLHWLVSKNVAVLVCCDFCTIAIQKMVRSAKFVLLVQYTSRTRKGGIACADDGHTFRCQHPRFQNLMQHHLIADILKLLFGRWLHYCWLRFMTRICSPLMVDMLVEEASFDSYHYRRVQKIV
jgi:hypothetical protein